jgi:hypothetical protein
LNIINLFVCIFNVYSSKGDSYDDKIKERWEAGGIGSGAVGSGNWVAFGNSQHGQQQ